MVDVGCVSFDVRKRERRACVELTPHSVKHLALNNAGRAHDAGRAQSACGAFDFSWPATAERGNQQASRGALDRVRINYIKASHLTVSALIF